MIVTHACVCPTSLFSSFISSTTVPKLGVKITLLNATATPTFRKSNMPDARNCEAEATLVLLALGPRNSMWQYVALLH
jgi:hypothetical protein